MRAPVWLTGCFVLALASPALADGAAHEPSDERAELERQLAQDYAALSTSDCAVACRALASMQRAADRLCALAPGKPCDDARAKVVDATRRVREQCPTCAIEGPREEQVVHAPQPTAAAPASDTRRGGGCASCSAAGERETAGGALTFLFGVAGFLGARGARRRGRR
jgi:hypothetical protein